MCNRPTLQPVSDKSYYYSYLDSCQCKVALLQVGMVLHGRKPLEIAVARLYSQNAIKQ